MKKRKLQNTKSSENDDLLRILVIKLWQIISIIFTIVEKGLGVFIFNPLMQIYSKLYNKRLVKVFKAMGNKEWALNGLVFSTMVLMIVGVMNAYSLRNIVSSPDAPLYGTLFFKHVIYLVFSSGIGYGIYKYIPYKNWGQKSVIKGLFFIVVIELLFVILFGESVNGSKRWINLKVLSIQPSEFAKVVVILAAAYYIRLERKIYGKVNLVYFKNLSNKEGGSGWIRKYPVLTKSIVPALILGALTFPQPDFGTAALIVGFPMLLLLFTIEDKEQIKKLIVIGLIALPLAVAVEPYRLQRIYVVLDPWSDMQGNGYQVVQSIVAVGSGHLWGFNNSILNLFSSGISKYSFLPECHTDFAFAVWSQEHGFFGCLIVFFAVTGIIYYGFCIAQQTKDIFGMLLAYGMSLMIGLQAIYNMLMVGGFGPVVGVPLPFVSYGGSAMAVNVWAIAILASIAKANKARRLAKKARYEAHVVEQEPRLMREEVKSRYRPGD